MRGADEAMRNPLELMPGSLLARTKLARTLAGDVPENAPEGAETVPAGLECDLDDWRVRVAEQRLGPARCDASADSDAAERRKLL